MDTEIYIDILILINIYVNYFLFLSTKKILGLTVTFKRIFIASALGGLYSLSILLTMSSIEFIFLKLIMGATLTVILFDYHSLKIFIKNYICFLGVNILFGGVMFFIWFFLKPYNMYFNNGVIYFDINATVLAVSTIISYLIIKIICYYKNKNIKPDTLYDIYIVCDDKQVKITGLVDTGNNLCDTYTGLPVLVCEYDMVAPLFPVDIKNYFQDFSIISTNSMLKWDKKPRMIPINSVTGQSILPAFNPDYIKITDKNGKQLQIKKKVVIAVTSKNLSNGEYKCLINPAVYT